MSLNQFDLSSEEYDGLFEKKVPSQLLQNPLLQKDIWLTIEDLGLEINEHDKRLSINFSEIQPLWLNLLAKLYILTRVNLKISIGSIRSDLIYIKKFACFITDKHLSSAKHIDNELFEEFDYWLDLNETGKSTKYHVYLSLKNLFNTCRIEGWLKINTYWFRARIKEPKNNNDSINYIPEEIWNQLEKHLSNFPPPM
ncbi:MAG: phage integrase SAM-like domain-containing protein, partial [Crocosphaera sp.]